MSRIFVNYRRQDSAPYAGRLYDRLVRDLGKDQVFMDIDKIDPGDDFVEIIEQRLGSCNAVIALIGQTWTSCVDASGARRLENPDDHVRRELGLALQRKIRVIPVLVGGAAMPRSDHLPEDLVPLCRRNAIEVSDLRFHQDVDRLVDVLRRTLAQPEEARPEPPVAPADSAAPPRVAALLPVPVALLLPPPVAKRRDKTAREPSPAAVEEGKPGPAAQPPKQTAKPALNIASAGDAPAMPHGLIEIGAERILRAHEKPVMSVAFSPDGKLLASAGGGEFFHGDCTIRVWRVADGKLLREIAGHKNHVTSVVFSPDGQKLASSSLEAVRLWRVTDGKRLTTLEDPIGEDVAFSPDGSLLAAGPHLWRVADGEHVRSFGGEDYPTDLTSAVAFAPDGCSIATSSDKGWHLWRVADGKPLLKREQKDAYVRGVAFSPDGRTLATGWHEQDTNTITLWSVPEGNKIRVIKNAELGGATSLAFSPDGGYLASTALAGADVWIWRTADGTLVTKQHLPDLLITTNEAHCVAFSPDSAWLAAACHDALVRLWPLRLK